MHFSLRRWFILPCGLPYARGYTKLTKCLAAPAMTDLANAKKTSWQPAGLSGTHCVTPEHPTRGWQDSGFFPLLSSTRGTSSHHPSHLLMWNCSHFIFFFPVIVAASPPPTSTRCCLRVFFLPRPLKRVPAETRQWAPRLHVNTQKQVANVF